MPARDTRSASETLTTSSPANGPPAPNRTAVSAAGSAAVDRIVAELTLCADTESVNRTQATVPELAQHQVGHSFIKVKLKPGTAPLDTLAAPTNDLLASRGETQLGFWPQGRFKSNPLDSWMAGSVREPDTIHNPKGAVTYDLSAAQLAALFGYVQLHRSSRYSVYFYNCTTFAVEATRAAGQTPPNGALFGGVCLPNALYAGILRAERAGVVNAKTAPLGIAPSTGGSETQESEEPDTAWVPPII